MADLNDMQAAQTVKLAGASSSGNETSFIGATNTGNIKSADIINEGTGVEGVLVVGLTAVEVKVGASKLANRKLLTLYNNSGNRIFYWGYTSSVTVTTGTPIAASTFITWNVGDNQSIYVISTNASLDARVTEGA